MDRENELRYGGNNGGGIDPINRRTSMSVSDMSSLQNNQQQQQRFCNICSRRDVSFDQKRRRRKEERLGKCVKNGG